MSTEQKRFEEWWDAKDDIPNNGPWTHDTPIQFAWAGWQAALPHPAQEPYGWVRPNPSFNSGVFNLGPQCPPGWAGSAVAVYKQNERLRRNDESMEDNDDK